MSLNFLRPSLRGVREQHAAPVLLKEESAQSNQPCEGSAQGDIDSKFSLRKVSEFRLDYGSDIEAEIARLQAFSLKHELRRSLLPRWFVVKLLEGDANIRQ